jgi:PAS domain S-box-containing protein
MVQAESVGDRYFELVKAYAAIRREEHLTAAGDLGRELARMGVPLEEVGRMHQATVERLRGELPDREQAERVVRASELLTALLTSYGLLVRRREEEQSRELAALREREARLSEGEAIAHVGTWDRDIATGELCWSDETYRIFGVQPGEFTPTYESFLAAVHREDRERVAAAVEAARRQDAPLDIEYRVVRPDGTVRIVCARGRIFRDEQGRPARMMGTVQDITERRTAEATLRVQSAALNAAASAIAITDRAGVIEWVNPAFTRLTGYSAEEAVGKRLRILKSGKQDAAFYRDLWNRILAGRVWRGELINRRKDGTLYIEEQTITPVRDDQGNIAHFVAIKQDISERKAAEAELREALAWQEAITEGSRDAIFVSDAESRFVMVNRAACELTGYSRDELLGMRIPDLHEEEDLQAYRKHHAAIWAGEEVISRAKILRKDGTKVDVEFNNRRITIAGTHYMHTVARDISERLSLEAQLRQSQRLEAVGQLAGGVAHDFNNLLTVVLANSQLLLEGLDRQDPARLELEEIRKAAERAASLTRQLLAFSRKQVLEPRPLDLNAVVADMEKLLRRLIGEHIELITVLEPELGTVEADIGQIEQVIVNLAINARDAMPDGGTLTIETANAELDPGYAEAHSSVRPGRYVVLVVSDTGCGMDSETASRIFEPFFTTKAMGEGSGLGLATVYGIVKQSGGHIWVYSEPGQGATFKIYLPRLDTVARSHAAATAASSVCQGSETILLVEDDDAVRIAVLKVLRRNGYTVLAASDAAEALAACERHAGPVHLVITDLIMPGTGGRELAQQVRRVRPEAAVLYISGYTDHAVLGRGMLEPDAHFLEKPFALDALMRKVRDVLDEHRRGGGASNGS